MAIEIPNAIAAAIKYDGVTDTIIESEGFASVIKSGPGIYLFTLEDEISRPLSFVSSTGNVASGMIPNAQVSGTLVAVLVEDNVGAFADDIINLWILSLPQNG